LRSPATKIANELEIVATAWHSGVADKEMLEEEFKDMFVGSERAKFLENFGSSPESVGDPRLI
jgi:hypothetical protein